jgi:hypothetical protein
MAAVRQDAVAMPELSFRTARESDVPEILRIERLSYPFPWTEGIFRDCLRVNYTCRVAEIGCRDGRLRHHECRRRARRICSICASVRIFAAAVSAGACWRICFRPPPSLARGMHFWRLDLPIPRRFACIRRSALCRSACAAGTTRQWMGAKMPSCSSVRSIDGRIARGLHQADRDAHLWMT